MKTQTQTGNVYEYNYLSPMEKNFIGVMNKQSQYDFLGHKNRTPEQEKRVLENIKDRVKKLSTQVLMFIGIIGMGLSMMSCEKDPVKEQELVEQTFKITNFDVTSMGLKSWDPNTWVYQYNPSLFELKFENINNPGETITRMVTVQDLINGITLSMYAGTYNLSYETIHSSHTNLDIKIDMRNVQIVGTPVELVAEYLDYLLVVDMSDILSVYMLGGIDAVFWFAQVDNYYYAYFNQQNDYYRLYVDFGSRDDVTIPTTNYVYGNVYWYTSPFNAGTTLTFPEWVINKIQL